MQIDQDRDWRGSIAPVLARLGVHPPNGLAEQIPVLWGALAPIGPRVLDDDLVSTIEQISVGLCSLRTITNADSIPSIGLDTYYAVALWTGDITTLEVDAVVNAANAQLLGCRIPNHACIDNAIHSFAGPRLRDDCAAVMDLQGHDEPVGVAKITRGHALPAKYVLHTVGPRLTPQASPTSFEKRQLADCYRSCLDLAAELPDISTMAFCGISTGVFSFPPRDAAKIALETIGEWIETHPGRFSKIIIDCYTPADTAIYEDLLHDKD